ncbi:hypothetical protein ACOYW6_11555 [Parablastomonas sp. CN1-191]|uniref:hypothetical protein n=1 Tax=Parablastomonas sp. CN1-191 TaxID=3400908 RepID=UPI003BF7C8E2
MTGNDGTAWRLESLPAAEQQDFADAPYDTWQSLDGDPVAEFRRRPSGYLVRFLGMADFAIDMDTGRAVATPVPEYETAMVEDLYFNQVLPLLMGHAGRPVIHASAAAVGARAVAFMGPTGRGKSTLAAAFAREGHPFLTDDGLILARDGAQRFIVTPRRPLLRLRPDSEAALRGDGAGDAEGAKQRVAAGTALPFGTMPLPLAALYWLADPAQPATPRFRRLGQPEALAQLLQHGFVLDVDDRASVRRSFVHSADVAERIPCFALDYRRAYDALPNVVSAIVSHARKEGLA